MVRSERDSTSPQAWTRRPLAERRSAPAQSPSAGRAGTMRRKYRRLADGLEVADDAVAGRHGPIRIRHYAVGGMASARVPLFWVHGGAFASGGLNMPESHAVACAITRTGREVTTVQYRTAPGFNPFRRRQPGTFPGVRYPVPLDDVIDAYRHVRDRSSGARLVLGGASAGACLSAAAALRLHAEDGVSPDR